MILSHFVPQSSGFRVAVVSFLTYVHISQHAPITIVDLKKIFFRHYLLAFCSGR